MPGSALRPKHRGVARFTLLAAMLATLMAFGAGSPALAADTSSSDAPADKLAPARVQIKAGQWKSAIDELTRANEVDNADWQNLMGYCLRKNSPPDFDGAERHYNEALRLNPRHRGALEYSGELYLMKGDLAKAEQRLAALDKACLFGCEEYTDLKKAIARYKAAGDRYVPGTYQ